ncbi:MAG: GTPase Era [Bryobacteraceae bacterium]|nr:GTPase Era [Bryobacteraceae bacterium]
MAVIKTQTEKTKFKSGFVSIVGRPNAGKSTLLNALVGTHLAIVADKPQTTRVNVQGILNSEGAQIVFVDSPGIHKANSAYNRRMMQEVRVALDERDLILYVADATRYFNSEDDHAVDLVRKSKTPAFLVLNKIDRLDNKAEMLAVLEKYKTQFEFNEYIPISAQEGDGLDKLKELILQYLPEGPAYFPTDQVTDQPERFMASELIREKILHVTRQEVPHSVAVFIEHWEEKPKLTRISANIYVERQGQKGILIGSGGSTLKQIGTAARQDIEEMLGAKVFLELFVKVQANWRENPAFLNQLDWKASIAGGGRSTAQSVTESHAAGDGPALLPPE